MNIVFDTLYFFRDIDPKRREMFKVQFATDPYSIIVTRTRVEFIVSGTSHSRDQLVFIEKQFYMSHLEECIIKLLCAKIFVHKMRDLEHISSWYKLLKNVHYMDYGDGRTLERYIHYNDTFKVLLK